MASLGIFSLLFLNLPKHCPEMQKATLAVTGDNVRSEAAKLADKEDATLWRWFSEMYEDGRIRWCRSAQGWLVSVDHRHLATEADFDAAIRIARERHFSGKPRRNHLRRSSVTHGAICETDADGRQCRQKSMV
jgi:hypothetical protein